MLATGDLNDLDARTKIQRRVPECRILPAHRLKGKELGPKGNRICCQLSVRTSAKHTTPLQEELERVLIPHGSGEDSLSPILEQRGERVHEQRHNVRVVDLASANTTGPTAERIDSRHRRRQCPSPSPPPTPLGESRPSHRPSREPAPCYPGCRLLVSHAVGSGSLLISKFRRSRVSGVCLAPGSSQGHSAPSQSPRSVARTSWPSCVSNVLRNPVPAPSSITRGDRRTAPRSRW